MRFILPFLFIISYSVSLYSQNSPCVKNTGYHIVVLGSSTAAGAGASPSDSAWVNRYRSYLQGFNSDYQVTNRAQGGFTSYQIMPTGFTPPTGRPNPNVTRNITYALSLNPDAIIVNLPSNDVSSGYSVQEQLDNLDTVFTQAQQAGVPIWICTTQPKNYGGNQVNIQKQLDVRDSIYSKYAPFAIDFWTGLADSTNQIASAYDSGDGTHLNNSGHYLLFTRVANTQIPDQLFVPSGFIDYSATKLNIPNLPVCGSLDTKLELHFYNRGLQDTSDVPVEMIVEHLPSGQNIIYQDTLGGGLTTCEEGQIDFMVNTTLEGEYRFIAVISSNQDGDQANDSIIHYQSFLGYPQLEAIPDTGCFEASLELMVITHPDDSIRWYDAPMGGNLIGGDFYFQTPPLTNTTIYYVEAVRGDFVYKDALPTTNTSGINWNGAMFDLVADTTLIIDSIGVKFADPGPQAIEVYTKPGSHLGFELDPNAWTLLGTFPVQVDSLNIPTVVNITNISMADGDSLGVYIQLQDPNARLSYQSVSQIMVRSTDQLTIITGSGSSHNFGGKYHPRDWNGVIYYHYGAKPDGDCLSDRVPVEAYIGNVAVELGQDTILDLTDSILLNPGNYATYQWSNGSTDSTLLMAGNSLGMGVYPVHITVADSLGCLGKDTIIVVFAPLVGLDVTETDNFNLFPNPVNQGESFFLELPEGSWNVELFDLTGRLLWSQKILMNSSDPYLMKIPEISPGNYQLIGRHVSGSRVSKRIQVR